MSLVRPGFVPRAECDAVVAAIRRAATGTDARRFPKRVEIDGRSFRAYPDVYRWLTHFRAAALEELNAAYPRSEPSFIEFTLLTEMLEGDAHPLHADNERRTFDGDWVPNHTPWRDRTALLYLNTSGVDFDGGILRFPGRGESITPVAGQLVGFTCGREHEHEVSPVSGGSRFTIAIWTTLDPYFAEEWEPAQEPAALRGAGPSPAGLW